MKSPRGGALAAVAVSILLGCQQSATGPGPGPGPNPSPNAGPPASIAVNSGNGQTAQVGAPVAIHPSVLVVDAGNRRVPRATVRFEPRPGSGTVTDGIVLTDDNGIATVGSWRLGDTPGSDTLLARVDGVAQPAVFTATATAQPAGAPAQLLAVEGLSPVQQVVAGAEVPVRPRVVVRDSAGVPVSNVRVEFAPVGDGSGTIQGVVQFTGPDGTARPDRWIADTRTGRDTVRATSQGLAAVDFIIEVLSGAPRTVVADAGDGQTANVASAVPVRPAVLVRDSLQNAVPGVTVTFAVGQGGGSVSGPTVVTDASGRATVGGWTLGPEPGANTLTATVTGLPSATFSATGIALVAASAGNRQTAPILATLPVAPAVQVRNGTGAVQAGVSVIFSVVTGGGRVTGATQVTDAQGVATLGSWALGPVRGEQRLRAVATGIGSFDFTATAQSSDVVATAVATAGFLIDSAAGRVSHTCFLTPSGALRCMGSNQVGQLGVGAADSLSRVPVTPAADPLFQTLVGGDEAMCALRVAPAGELWCWGRARVATASGAAERFGDPGLPDTVATPRQVQAGQAYAQVTLGRTHACGRTPSGEARCWGDNTFGQLGDGTSGTVRATPVTVGGGHQWALLSAGDGFTCGIATTGISYCWGDGSRGRLGNGSTDSRTTPTPVTVAGFTLTTLSAGEQHVCGVTSGRLLVCWGDNGFGQLGLGTALTPADTVRLQPDQVRGAGESAVWERVTAAAVHSCAIDVNGTVACWGANQVGATALGLTGTGSGAGVTPSPAAIVSARQFSAVDAAALHTCAVVRTDGALVCWGSNLTGALGEPNVATAAAVPVRAVAPGATPPAKRLR